MFVSKLPILQKDENIGQGWDCPTNQSFFHVRQAFICSVREQAYYAENLCSLTKNARARESYMNAGFVRQHFNKWRSHLLVQECIAHVIVSTCFKKL